MRLSVKNFIIPHHYPKRRVAMRKLAVCAVIPSFKPSHLTINLVIDLLVWNPRIRIYVVDDHTPRECEKERRIFTLIRAISPRVTLLRTPFNRMKAGAINYALQRILARKKSSPDIVITLDDDVVINASTVNRLTKELFSYDHLGAVCSQCRVLNKDKNTLTRLQGLEYVGFNATRLADEGFYQGPLVMHGMLTAFRACALRETGGFMEHHLLEDYEITARLKGKGWHVKAVTGSLAWTKVPETFDQLWKQRARWLYGGITILSQVKYWPAVIQDIIGHGMFLATLGVIAFSFLGSGGAIPAPIPTIIIALALTQLVVWYVFQVWLMRMYPERDRYDWALRLSLIPEFLYANVMTLVLLGSYLFFFTNRSFYKIGYTQTWGTRGV